MKYFMTDYIEVADGVAVQFRPDAEPWIMWNHIDGPMLVLRNGSARWLSLWERFLCWLGAADARTLEWKYAADFVRRWEAHLASYEHRVGKYRADYTPLTPEEVAQPIPEVDELYANSKPVTPR